MNERIPHFFSSEDIALLMNDPTIALHKEKPGIVRFSITLPETIQTKLKTIIHVPQTIPMTWVRGDMVEHVDQGISPFDHTYLIYLTDSSGQFVVDGQSYPIEAGAAHIFSEGLSHSTLHTEERLIMGPMSERGLPVGIPYNAIYYVPSNRTDVFMVYGSYSDQALILNIPPAVPEVGDYFIFYVNESGIDNIWDPPPGKIFGGWKLLDYPDNVPIGDNSVDKIYMPGEIYTYTTTSILVPNWIDVAKPRFGMHFNDNARVFYKQSSLSTGSGGVRNYRAKQRKT